jgi:hypothetical protein
VHSTPVRGRGSVSGMESKAKLLQLIMPRYAGEENLRKDYTESFFDLQAGSDDVLVVAGSIQLQDGTPANVAKYYFSNSTWAAIGSGLPGPVTAVSVNDDNIENIFAAGRYVIGRTSLTQPKLITSFIPSTSDGDSPFMLHWDGKSWNPISLFKFQGRFTYFSTNILVSQPIRYPDPRHSLSLPLYP